jgi:hypothetical protein
MSIYCVRVCRRRGAILCGGANAAICVDIGGPRVSNLILPHRLLASPSPSPPGLTIALWRRCHFLASPSPPGLALAIAICICICIAIAICICIAIAIALAIALAITLSLALSLSLTVPIPIPIAMGIGIGIAIGISQVPGGMLDRWSFESRLILVSIKTHPYIMFSPFMISQQCGKILKPLVLDTT